MKGLDVMTIGNRKEIDRKKVLMTIGNRKEIDRKKVLLGQEQATERVWTERGGLKNAFKICSILKTNAN